MPEVFLYNEATDKLHIKGYCRYTKNKISDFRKFDSEDEALAHDGRAVSMCKLCLRERERRLKEAAKK